MQKFFARLASLFIVLAMALTALPALSFADENDKKGDAIQVYSQDSDNWAGANIILGTDASVWPFSTGQVAAFTPEKDATYVLKFNVTSLGCSGFRVRWLKDDTNGSYTAADTLAVNDYTYAATDVATMVPAYFSDSIARDETKTYTVDVTMSGSEQADGLIGNLAIRGQGGSNEFTVNAVSIAKQDGTVLASYGTMPADDGNTAPAVASTDGLTAIYSCTFGDDWAEHSADFPTTANNATFEQATDFGRTDSYSLKATHTGTDYTSSNCACKLTFPTPLAAGGIYRITAWFYVPSADNPNKSTLTGPGIVINGNYGGAQGVTKFPSNFGTIKMDEWKEIDVTLPVMTDPIDSIDLRFVINDADKHPDVWYIDDIDVYQTGQENVQPAVWDLTLPSLAQTYAGKFLVGNVLSPGDLTNDTLMQMYKDQYNVVTCENDMKPIDISKAEGQYDFTNADKIITWAQANNMPVHGHCLVWHQQSPNWLNIGADGNPLTRAQAEANLATYIQTVCTHFAGEVISWDVVNEAFGDYDNTQPTWQDALRVDSPWYLAFANGADASKGESGADYIYEAFKLARKYDPAAKLFYNDYNENYTPKREAIAMMAEDLNNQWKSDPDYDGRLLVEGIGMQSHFNTNYMLGNVPPSTVEDAIKRFSGEGLSVAVSELDLTVGNYGGRTDPLTPDEQVLQAQMYAQLFQIYNKYADVIDRVTIWGKNDAQSWRAPGWPVLFGKYDEAKDAFYAAIDPASYIAAHPLPDTLPPIDLTPVASTVTPAPTDAPTDAPTTAPAATPAPTPVPTATPAPGNGGFPVGGIVGIIAGVVIVAAVVVIVVVKGKKKK